MAASAIEFTRKPFSVTFRPCTRKPESWDKEVKRAAFSLVAQAGSRPIVVCFSGGVDSEVLCRSLFEQGIHFSALTIVDSKGCNTNEAAFATHWCRSRGVSQHLVRLDFEDFYKNGIERYVEKGYTNINAFRYLQFFLLEHVQSMGGFAVLAGGEPRINISEEGDARPYFLFSAGAVAPIELAQADNNAHQPYFYLSSPELVRSFLQTPMLEMVLRHPEMLKNKTNRSILKRFVQYTYWPDAQRARKIDDDFRIRKIRSEKERELYNRFGKQASTLKLYIEDALLQLEKNI